MAEMRVVAVGVAAAIMLAKEVAMAEGWQWRR